MKKIFTLAAAVLASVTMMAQDAPSVDVEAMTDAASETYFTSYNGDAVTLSLAATYETFNNAGGYYVKLDQTNNTAYVGVTAQQEITKVAFLVTGNGDNKNINAGLIGYTEVTENPDFAHVDYATNIAPAVAISSKYYENAQWVEFDLTGLELKAIYFAKQWKNVYIGESTSKASYPSGNAQSLFVYGIRVWAGAAVPMTDPVASVTVAGPTEAFVGQKASYTATTDVKANAYKWFVNDAEQEGATSAKFDFTPDAEGNYSIVCQAKNDNNADFVASEAIVLVASVRPVVERVSVSASTTWDFANAATANVQAENADDFFVFANLDGEWAENFAANAIEGRAQYFYYKSNNCFQGHALRFTTTVAGTLTVEFSNTGKPERPYRHLYLNGADVNPELKSNSTTKLTAENIAVEAGDILLEGMMEDKDENENDIMTPNMLRFYKVIFTAAGETTGINNAEEAVKAVKVIRDGQLFIEKNGVLFNAQGARL